MCTDLLGLAPLSLGPLQALLPGFSFLTPVAPQAEIAGAHPEPTPFPVSPAPTSPVVGSCSHQRVHHSLPAAAAVSKSGSSSAPGPGQPPAPRQSPAAMWPGPTGREGLSQGHTLPPHRAPEDRAVFLTSQAFPSPPQSVSLRSNFHPSTDLRSLKDHTLSSILTSQSITHLTWPSLVARSFYQAAQRH